MKKTLLLGGVAVLALVGCHTAHHDRHYTRTHYNDRPDVVYEQPGGRQVIVDRNGDRTYVREYDNRYENRRYYGEDRWYNQPQYRGKHPDTLGWNDPYWYHNRY